MAVTTFIPELWAARLLSALENAHVATSFVNRDYEGEIKRQGDTVHINSLNAISIGNYVAGTPISVGQLTTTDNTLVISQSKYFAFSVEDIDKVQSAGDLVDEAMANAGYALNDVADSYLFATMAAGAASGNILPSVKLTASNIYERIVALRLKLDKANCPKQGRSLAIPPEAYALLLQDERFTKVAAQAEQVVRSGEVGTVAGFTVFETNNLPVSGSDIQIVASAPLATTYAEQIVETEALRQQDQFGDLVRGLHVYGAKVLRPSCIAVLNSNY